MIIFFKQKKYKADLSKPLDISIPLHPGSPQLNCFYAPPMEATPVKADGFIGATDRGGPVNFFNLRINPHGNGTHTECAGHIARPGDFHTASPIVFTINECLEKFHFFSKLATLYPVRQPNGDRVISPVQIQEILQPGEAEALILRTMPNEESKLTRNYSGTNPPYLDHRAAEYMVDCGIQHLLIDLPSVDREQDGGQLLAHRAFWKYPANEQMEVKNEKGAKQNGLRRVDDFERKNCTITELIYVANSIKDGLYLLNLQIAPLEVDASPSKPVLYHLTEG